MISKTNTMVNEKTMETILGSCNSLEKLAVNHVQLSNVMISNIGDKNGKTLKVLDLEGCFSFPMNDPHKLHQSTKDLIKNCKSLIELNLGIDMETWTSQRQFLTTSDYLSNNLTVNIQKLNLKCSDIKDADVEILVSRCKKLTELNLHRTWISDESLDYIITHLKSTLEKLDVSDCIITWTKFLDLKAMKKLKVLVHTGWILRENMDVFKKALANVDVQLATSVFLGPDVLPVNIVANVLCSALE